MLLLHYYYYYYYHYYYYYGQSCLHREGIGKGFDAALLLSPPFWLALRCAHTTTPLLSSTSNERFAYVSLRSSSVPLLPPYGLSIEVLPVWSNSHLSVGAMARTEIA